MPNRGQSFNHRHRLGPRPLPFHLMLHASTLLSSRIALPLLRSGSLPWKPSLRAEAQAIRQALDAAGPDAWTEFDRELAAETIRRHQAVLSGISAYRAHLYCRDVPEPPTLWQEGSTRLLDYRLGQGAAGVPVLMIPSLVNRAYILDLTKQHSLMRALAERGIAPFLVDWGAPGPTEAAFTLTDYITQRLEAALAEVSQITGCARIPVVGYCMGGNLALALASRCPEGVASLAMLATPWDFHAGDAEPIEAMRLLFEPLNQLIGFFGDLPVDFLQMMFSGLDLFLTARKFAAFGRLEQNSARATDFVALEDWANDGVPLVAEVARECLEGWYGANDPMEGRWRVAGQPVQPETLRLPTLAMVPIRDRIVPPQSAYALARAIPGARIHDIQGGHVGMLLSARADKELYTPLAEWLYCASGA